MKEYPIKQTRCDGKVGRGRCTRTDALFELIKIGKKRMCKRCFDVYKISLWRLVPDIYMEMEWLPKVVWRGTKKSRR